MCDLLRHEAGLADLDEYLTLQDLQTENIKVDPQTVLKGTKCEISDLLDSHDFCNKKPKSLYGQLGMQLGYSIKIGTN